MSDDCYKCTVPIKPGEGIKCKLCLRKIHIKCATSRITQANIDSEKKNFFFFCQECSTKLQQGELRNETLLKLLEDEKAQKKTIYDAYKAKKDEIDVLTGANLLLEARVKRLQENHGITKGTHQQMDNAEGDDIINAVQKEMRTVQFNFSKLESVVNNLAEMVSALTQMMQGNLVAEQPNPIAQPTSARRVMVNQITEKSKVTYAKALKSDQSNPLTIKKIKVVSEIEDDAKKVMSQLRSDNVCGDTQIVDVKGMGQKEILIKCNTVDDANKVQERLTEKYGTQIAFTEVKVFTPMVKISHLLTTAEHKHDIKDQLIDQNKWILPDEFEIKDMYLTIRNDPSARTIIATCSPKMLEIFIEQKYVIFGLKKSQIFEHIDLLQCARCWRYGHMARNCSATEARCKKCTGDHISSKCDSEPKLECVNCLAENKKGKKFNINHQPTSDRCPTRKARIEGLKAYHLAKNSKKN